MPGGKGKIHEHPKAGSNGFDKRPKDRVKGGRKPSIRKSIVKLMNKDGFMEIPAKQVHLVKEDGSVVVKIPTDQQLALKLTNMAMSGRGNEAINAIKLLREDVDGKAVQKVQVVDPHEQWEGMTDEEIEEKLYNYYQLLKKKFDGK